MSVARWGIPDSWHWVDVDSIADVIGGGTPSAGDPDNFSEDGIPWLTPADLSRNRATYVTGGNRFLSQRGYDNSGAQLLPKGAVLFSSRAPIGYCAIAERPLCTNQGFKSLVLRDGLVPEYIRHYLLASKNYAESEASGTTFLELSGARMRTLSVPVAPVAEQKRIVAKVEELIARSRRAKEALDAVPPLLDQLRQSILAAAFRGDLTAVWRAKNPNVEPADRLLARIRAERRSRWEAAELARMTAKGKRPVDDEWKDRYEEPVGSASNHGDTLPAGWAFLSVDEISFVVRGASPRPARDPRYFGGSVPWITVGSLTKDQSPYLREVDAFVTEAGRDASRFVEPGTFLLTNSGATLGVPKITLIGGCINDGSVALLDVLLDKLYLYFFLTSQTRALRRINQGAAQPNLNTRIVREISVPVPSPSEQAEIVRRIEEAFLRVAALEEALSQTLAGLEKFGHSTLAKAFQGELVPQDPNDEPASVLVDRIRAARDTEHGKASETPRRVRKAHRASEATDDDDHEVDVSPRRPDSAQTVSRDLSELDPAFLQDEVSAALWLLGRLEKDAAVRRVADHLRQAGHVEFERLRADGPLFVQVLDAIESAVKTGRLDRPKRGQVRACKPDATTYTPDDWRHALVASLGTDPVDRDDAIRAAAEWARDNLGLEFARLREDGHTVEGLRSALNSAIRRGDIIRYDAKLISRKT